MTYANTYTKHNSGANAGLLPPGQRQAMSPGMGKAVHDFRSAVNIIIGYSELMLDDGMGKMTEEQRRSMQDILKSSRHLVDIVDDIVLLQTPQRA